jgi:ribosome-dependent ATPase
MGSIWPATYYMQASLGAYTKGLSPGLMMGDVLFLAGCIPVLLGISVAGLHKQEK